jgi:hypothetical protein
VGVCVVNTLTVPFVNVGTPKKLLLLEVHVRKKDMLNSITNHCVIQNDEKKVINIPCL